MQFRKLRLNQSEPHLFAIILGAGGVQPPSGLEAELNTRKDAGVARVLPSGVANRLRSLVRGTGQKDTVFVGLASIPSRVESLEKVINSLLGQADEIGVYLNNYEDVPAFLKHPRIRVARSQKHGDVRDNGKFFFVEKTKCTRIWAKD